MDNNIDTIKISVDATGSGINTMMPQGGINRSRTVNFTLYDIVKMDSSHYMLVKTHTMYNTKK